MLTHNPHWHQRQTQKYLQSLHPINPQTVLLKVLESVRINALLTGGKTPFPFSPIMGALQFAPSETESGQLVKGPASLQIDKLEGLTKRIRIWTSGLQVIKCTKCVYLNKSTLQQNWWLKKRPKKGISVSSGIQIMSWKISTVRFYFKTPSFFKCNLCSVVVTLVVMLPCHNQDWTE